MKKLLLLMMAVVLVGCSNSKEQSEEENAFKTKPKKLTEAEITEALSLRVGTWQIVEKSSGRIYETYTGKWVKKGESIEIKGKPEGGPLAYNQTVTYDAAQMLFIENFNDGQIIRHTTWNADTKTLETMVVEPKLPAGVSQVLFIKTISPNRYIAWAEMRKNNELMEKVELIGSRVDVVNNAISKTGSKTEPQKKPEK